MVLTNYLFFQYCNSNIELFSIAPCKVIVKEAMKKRKHESKYKTIQKLSKDVMSDNFCYLKVGRAITKWGAIEKSSILQCILIGYQNLSDFINTQVFTFLLVEKFKVQLTVVRYLFI